MRGIRLRDAPRDQQGSSGGHGLLGRHTAVPAMARRAAAAAGRQPPRYTRYQNTLAPTTISMARPIQPPTTPRPQCTPRSQVNGGVVSHAVAIPTTAA